MESLLISGVQKFPKKDIFTHPWRVSWYRSTGVSFGRCVFSSMKSYWYQESRMRLLNHGEFTEGYSTFTHPWRVYWYQESRSFIWKMRLLNHREFTGIRSPELSYGRCVYSSIESLLVSGVQSFI
jgi:hypothetical protein